MKKQIVTVTFYLLVVNGFCQTQTPLQRDDSSAIKLLIKQVEALQTQSTSYSSSINALLTGKDLDAINKYSLVKQNLTNAIITFQLLNTKINILKAKTTSDKVDNFIKDLNNPQSNTLGFKLDETIIRLVNKNIQPKKKNLAKNIIATVSSITQSPIVTSIPTISPALSVANAVLGVLRSTSIVSEEVDQLKIKAFETDLNNYVEYYVVLNDCNAGFTYSLNNQIQELGLLQQKLYDQVTFFAKTLNYPISTKNENEQMSIYLNNLFLGFNKTFTDKIFFDLEKANTNALTNKVNYEAMLSSNNGNLKDANNRLEEFFGLINQFEFQYNGYFNIYEIYTSKIVKALDIAGTNKIADLSLVITKKTEFSNLKNQAIADIHSSLNLPELLLSKQTIKYTARIL